MVKAIQFDACEEFNGMVIGGELCKRDATEDERRMLAELNAVKGRYFPMSHACGQFGKSYQDGEGCVAGAMGTEDAAKGLVDWAFFLANAVVESSVDDSHDEVRREKVDGRHAIANSCMVDVEGITAELAPANTCRQVDPHYAYTNSTAVDMEEGGRGCI